MKHVFATGALYAALLVFSGTANANDLPAAGLTRNDVLTWLQGHGYTATIQYDQTAKDQYVSTTYNGTNFGIYFFACDGDTCRSIQYSAGWSGKDDTTTDSLNAWNRDKRYLRAYKDESGSVFGEYDVDVVPGGTWEAMDQTLSRWQDILPVFKAYIGE